MEDKRRIENETAQHSDTRFWLNKVALEIGENQLLVQGAGGNLSGKTDDGVLLIKASGTRLKDAEQRNIFVPLYLERAKQEVLVTEKISKSIVRSDQYSNDMLRPSIETAIHALLPQRFVFHVHAVATIAASCGDHAVSLAPLSVWAAEQDIAFMHIPYAKPGIELARAIQQTGDMNQPYEELVIVLGNHGLITAANNAQRALDLIYETERILKQHWMAIPDIRLEHIPHFDHQYHQHNWEYVTSFHLPEERVKRLFAGPLTPDSAVFLGPKPCTDDPSDPISLLLIRDNALFVRPEVRQDAREIAQSLLWVANCFVLQSVVNVLSDERVAELVDWEAEQWRQQMQT